jgi:LytS/YehU family sensor histidine kinase
LQVSPHFLFNTLNNIRWLARKKSDQTEGAVVMLAQLLRYMIYQARQEQVPLRQEVDQLRNYIDLQKMRLTDRHPVSFHVEGNIDAHQVEPLLFIPFVENAFKYGAAVAEGGGIDIRLMVTDYALTFETHNPTAFVTVPPPPDESGIGIENVRKRLALHYPDRHSLSTGQADGQFNVHLLLHLQHEQVALHRH